MSADNAHEEAAARVLADASAMIRDYLIGQTDVTRPNFHATTLAAMLAPVFADVWDEGVRRSDRAWHDGDAISVFDRNPFRASALRANGEAS